MSFQSTGNICCGWWRNMSNTIIMTAFIMAWRKIARSRCLRNRFARAGESLPGRDSAGYTIVMSGRRPPEILWSKNLLWGRFPIGLGAEVLLYIFAAGWFRPQPLFGSSFFRCLFLSCRVNFSVLWEKFNGRILPFLSLRDLQVHHDKLSTAPNECF